MHTSNAKQNKVFIHCFLLAVVNKLLFSYFPGSKASPHVTITWEDECHNHKCSPFLLFLSFYGWGQHHMIWNIPLVSQVTCPSYTPPYLLPTFSLITVREERGKRENSVKVLLINNQNTVLSTGLVTKPKHSTIWDTTKKVYSIPARLSTITYFRLWIELPYCFTMKTNKQINK